MYYSTRLRRAAACVVVGGVASACLAALAAAQAPVTTPPSTLTVEYQPPGLFAGQRFTINLDIWGEAALCSVFAKRDCHFEVQRDGVSVERFPWPPFQTGVQIRTSDNAAHMRGSLGMGENVAGRYAVRALFNGRIVAETAFEVEPWGEPADGVQVSLAADKPAYGFGESIGVTMSVRNVGDLPVRVPVPNDDRQSLGEGRGWAVLAGDVSQSSDDELVREELKPYGLPAESKRVDLQPGQTLTGRFRLDRLRARHSGEPQNFGKRPGTYYILLSRWAVGPLSNTILITIRPTP